MKNHKKIIPILDQGMVSVLSLLSSFLVLNFSGMDEFSALQFTAIFLFLGVSLTNSSVVACEAKNTSLTGVGRSCGALLVILIIVSFYSMAVFLLLPRFNIISDIDGASSVMLAFFAFFYLLQDAMRRLLMVNDLEVVSLFSDFISYGGQVLFLAAVYWIDFDVEFNDVVICLCASSAFACVPLILKIKFKSVNIEQQFCQVWSESVVLSRTLTLSAVMKFFSNQSVFIYAGVLLPSEVFGSVKATQLLYKPFNLFLVAYESYLPKIFFLKANVTECLSLAKKLGFAIGGLLVLYVFILNFMFDLFPGVLPIGDGVMFSQSILWAFFYYLMSVSLLQRTCLRVLGSESGVLMSSFISLLVALIVWLLSEELVADGNDVIVFSICVCLSGVIPGFYFIGNARGKKYV